MNVIQINKAVYKIQDLVIRKELKSFEKFKTKFQNDYKFDKDQKSYKFLISQFKKIYTFLKTIQHYPNSVVLVQALKPMFKMLLRNLVIPEYVCIYDERWQSYHKKIIYDKLPRNFIFHRKKLKQIECGYFIIPYKAKVPTLATLAKREN